MTCDLLLFFFLQRKLILKYSQKYRLGLWKPRADAIKAWLFPFPFSSCECVSCVVCYLSCFSEWSRHSNVTQLLETQSLFFLRSCTCYLHGSGNVKARSGNHEGVGFWSGECFVLGLNIIQNMCLFQLDSIFSRDNRIQIISYKVT